ncbi:hypothetical protein LPJ73_000520 [Coemansia sp. RSA 2703]|nr:hypothetical protein LPJ73_000520 [Coemansia sp. RSA 2703]KAJ2379416.1 hypothetical protein IW150_000183 [Coemansia sp. RSA 2607]
MHIQESKHEIYQQDAELLELREFIVRHSIFVQSESTDGTPLRPRPALLASSDKPHSIPVVPLCSIANSLLEENRYEDGVRFLSTVGSQSLAQNASLIENLLRVFRPTAAIETELKQRSNYLIQATAGNPADYSAIWTIDDERREAIVQSQGCVLGYLFSVNTQFMRPWFEKRFEAMADEFWDYVGELMTEPPESTSSEKTQLLELDMYRNRVTLVGLLLEQMCADLAANAADAWQSVFMRIVSEGFSSSGCVSYPKRLLSRISECLRITSNGRCLQEERQVVRLLFDLLSATTACETVAKSNCVQEIAKWMLDMTPRDMTVLVDLISSDTLAVDVLSYLLLSWYRFIDPSADGPKGTVRRQIASMQPGIERTAQFVRTTLPPPKSDSIDDWYFMVCVLSLLVQRSVGAFVRRMCCANSEAATDGSTHFPTLIVAGRSVDTVDVLRSACQELEDRVRPLVDGSGECEPLKSPKGAGRVRSKATKDGGDNNDDGEMNGAAETRAKIGDELDFLTAFVQSL